MNGQLIYSTKMKGTTLQIDLSPFQKGVYFITIRSEDFVTTRKVIKLLVNWLFHRPPVVVFRSFLPQHIDPEVYTYLNEKG
jgi:hypothetical protein